MTALAWLIPAALVLGGLGLVAFLWALKTNQYEDLDGAAWRALQDEEMQGNGLRTPASAAGAEHKHRLFDHTE